MAAPSYIDEENVETALYRARNNQPPPLLNILEQRQVIAILTQRGWTADRIAHALGVTPRSIERRLVTIRNTSNRKETTNVH